MSKPQAPTRDLRLAFFALLGVWISIELLYSSRWLDTSSSQQQTPPASKAENKLASLLAPAPGQRPERVWFAPYTTFPETGMVESQLRRGVYDTFLAFPAAGIITNYGAYKLTPADSLFAQASSQGLRQEAILAQRLGYRLFAIDLGAVTTPEPLQSLCASSRGCRLSSDGYALLTLTQNTAPWIPALDRIQRRQPKLPQITAAPRWAGMVFHPDQWWQPELVPSPSTPTVLVWARPAWTVQLYRYDPADLPPAVRQGLGLDNHRVWLRLAPGLKGATVCLKQERPGWHGGSTPCSMIQLRASSPRMEIGPMLTAGQVTTLKLEWIYGPEGLPYPLRMLPKIDRASTKQSAFAVELSGAAQKDAPRPSLTDPAHHPPLRHEIEPRIRAAKTGWLHQY